MESRKDLYNKNASEKGVDMVSLDRDTMIRISKNPGWYQALYKSYGCAPNARELYDIAHKKMKNEVYYNMDKNDAEGMAEKETMEAAKKRVESLERVKDIVDKFDDGDIVAQSLLEPETYEQVYKPAVEALSHVNAAVKKSARDSALILSKMAENFHKNYGVPLKMAALKIAGGEASRGERTLPQYFYQDLRGNDTIRKEEITPIVTITGTEFGGIVDKKDLQQAGKQYYRNNLQGTKAHNDLLGNIRFEESESETEPRFTGKGLNEMKHTLGDSKKIYAIPYLKDFIRESDVITVSDIQKDKHSKWKRFYYLHSAFKLDGETYYIVTSVVDKGEKNGGLQYYNHNVFTEKQYEKIENAANEALRQDVSSIPGASHQTASSSDFSIYHTNKIYKRKRNTENEFHQMAGERANTAMISRLQKAESMEREAASSEEIWKETGWMRGPDHKWRFEIPDHLDQFNSRK